MKLISKDIFDSLREKFKKDLNEELSDQVSSQIVGRLHPRFFAYSVIVYVRRTVQIESDGGFVVIPLHK